MTQSMSEELQRYLDGELPAETLSAELREEARVWDVFLTDIRAAGPTGAPVGLESRVVRAVLAVPPPPVWKRAIAWWIHPRPIRVSPLAGLAAAAGIILMVVGTPAVREGAEPVAEQTGEPLGATAATTGDVPSVYVPFHLEAPTARSVSLAGDFTGWSPQVTLEDADGDGVWRALVPLPPGVHEYMFVVDESTWVTDPHAERHADDSFGNRNAVLAIAEPQSSGT